MLVMRITNYPAYPIRELMSSQKTVWLDNFALAVFPLGLDGVKPRTLLVQKATPSSLVLGVIAPFS
jgi:hypothetical protein